MWQRLSSLPPPVSTFSLIKSDLNIAAMPVSTSTIILSIISLSSLCDPRALATKEGANRLLHNGLQLVIEQSIFELELSFIAE